MAFHTGTHQLKIICNLIQENSVDNYEFSSAEKRVLNKHRLWTSLFYGEKIFKAFSLPNGFRVTVELELNILQSFSGIEQRGNINNFCLN